MFFLHWLSSQATQNRIATNQKHNYTKIEPLKRSVEEKKFKSVLYDSTVIERKDIESLEKLETVVVEELSDKYNIVESKRKNSQVVWLVQPTHTWVNKMILLKGSKIRSLKDIEDLHIKFRIVIM